MKRDRVVETQEVLLRVQICWVGDHPVAILARVHIPGVESSSAELLRRDLPEMSDSLASSLGLDVLTDQPLLVLPLNNMSAEGARPERRGNGAAEMRSALPSALS